MALSLNCIAKWPERGMNSLDFAGILFANGRRPIRQDGGAGRGEVELMKCLDGLANRWRVLEVKSCCHHVSLCRFVIVVCHDVSIDGSMHFHASFQN